ncbi:MAG: pentapeptide repeat-containing protein [Pseudomonadota bacterium]
MTADEIGEETAIEEPIRVDYENAVQAFFRIRHLLSEEEAKALLDFRDAQLPAVNLQKEDLSGGLFDRANLSGAFLTGVQAANGSFQGTDLRGARLGYAKLNQADLRWAQLQGAILIGAQLQGAFLNGARLQGAFLNGAQLQGAGLGRAQLQGANLVGAEFDEATSLKDATLRGASLREVDCTSLPEFTRHLDDIFADASVTPPGGARPGDDGWPKHWATEVLGADFYSAWRAWQRSIGFDPDDPATGDKPQP